MKFFSVGVYLNVCFLRIGTPEILIVSSPVLQKEQNMIIMNTMWFVSITLTVIVNLLIKGFFSVFIGTS